MNLEDQKVVGDDKEDDKEISHAKEAELGQGGHWETTELPVIERPAEVVHMERGFKSQPNSDIYELDAG